jgi:myo-inositol-1-phosphate synthase
MSLKVESESVIHH